MRLVALRFLLPVLLAACGPQVLVEGEGGGSTGSAGGAGGTSAAASADQLAGACAEACGALEPPCNAGTDCTALCATFVAVAATSDACAAATVATVACMAKLSPANGCDEPCPDTVAPFGDCFATWCEQQPAACSANTGSGQGP